MQDFYKIEFLAFKKIQFFRGIRAIHFNLHIHFHASSEMRLYTEIMEIHGSDDEEEVHEKYVEVELFEGCEVFLE